MTNYSYTFEPTLEHHSLDSLQWLDVVFGPYGNHAPRILRLIVVAMLDMLEVGGVPKCRVVPVEVLEPPVDLGIAMSDWTRM
jgi:hypothetical protein